MRLNIQRKDHITFKNQDAFLWIRQAIYSERKFIFNYVFFSFMPLLLAYQNTTKFDNCISGTWLILLQYNKCANHNFDFLNDIVWILFSIMFSIMNTVYLLRFPVKIKGYVTVRNSQLIKSHGVKWVLWIPARWNYL